MNKNRHTCLVDAVGVDGGIPGREIAPGLVGDQRCAACWGDYLDRRRDEAARTPQDKVKR
jgi:hypothetical protein